MSRRGGASVAANPVLIGTVTILVAIVAVFLAYSANTGLPFVPTTEVKVKVANAAELVKGNEIREGGFRVGVVERIQPVMENGQAAAELTLKLDKKAGGMPVDSTIQVRPRSVLGLKYVQITRGLSHRDLQDGDTIPMAHTSVPVELDEVFSTFDRPTRNASRENLVTFGGGLAGRGQDLNKTITQLPELFRRLTNVTGNLSDPRTGLVKFFQESAKLARLVVPVAGTQARLFTSMAITFDAFSRDTRALEDTISKSPGTLDVATDSLRAQRPFLADFATFSRALLPASIELRKALPVASLAIEAGTRVLPRTIPLNRELNDTLAALRDFSVAPGTNQALRGLTATTQTLNPQLRFLGPYQTVCDYWNYWWTSLAEHFSAPDPNGQSQRVLGNQAGGQSNSVGSTNATEPANGEGVTPATNAGSDPQFLHGQAYYAAVDNKGAADCENGQRGYPMGRLAQFAPARDSMGKPFNIVADSHTPGNQGPTFKGRTRVPRGETFSREPQTPGAALP